MAGEKVLLLDPIAGISGDMFLGAMLDLGVSPTELEAQLRRLDLHGWGLRLSRVERHAIFATSIEVYEEHAEHHHHHRPWKEIERLIARSALTERAMSLAMRIFRVLAEAEASVHGVAVEDVEFHEVGAVDSIIDICGAAIALDLLDAPRIFSLPPPLGSGITPSAHGPLPIPAPATVELLRGLPVRFDGQGELTTPTGAAILRALAEVGTLPAASIHRVGYGAGQKTWADRPNLLRAMLATSEPRSAGTVVLECNIDDCSPQILAAVVELALERGALDAWVTPIVMKKGRAAHLLSVLTDEDRRSVLASLLLEETTTLGLREYPVRRTVLERSSTPVQTPWGTINVKVGYARGEAVTATPEFDECLAVAKRHGVRLKDVQAAAVSEWRNLNAQVRSK